MSTNLAARLAASYRAAVTFVPSTSIPAASVAIVGTVDVGDRAGRLLGHVTVDNASLPVTGPLTNAELRASAVDVGDGGGSLTVDGPLTAAQLAAAEPLSVDVLNPTLAVTGPLTDTELRASPVEVDGSAVTQPVSVDELPLPDGAADNKTLSEVALTAILERERLAVS